MLATLFPDRFTLTLNTLSVFKFETNCMAVTNGNKSRANSTRAPKSPNQTFPLSGSYAKLGTNFVKSKAARAQKPPLPRTFSHQPELLNLDWRLLFLHYACSREWRRRVNHWQLHKVPLGSIPQRATVETSAATKKIQLNQKSQQRK